jgi:hypothetical protein
VTRIITRFERDARDLFHPATLCLGTALIGVAALVVALGTYVLTR